MKNDLQTGLQNIIDAINNLIEPKLGSLRYDKTFRAKVISDEGNNVYGVQINGKNYKAVYTGEKIPVGQIVKVKAPLNNFSDIYIETLPGSGSGSAGNYNDLLNKPILNTNNTGTQVPSATETIQGTISLHKVSKTGNYNDLLNKPTLDFIPTSEKGAANGVAGLDENKKVSKSNLPTDTVYDNNYVHTDNNFTTAMKNKLDSVEEGAEPNKIEIIQRNGSVLPINNKIVNVEVPTKTSDLTNDNGFISSIPVASDTMLGGIKVGENLSITADGVLSAKGGGTTDYSVLLNKPVLNTANTKSLAVDSNETINGVVSLHKISKTGSYEDLLNKPTIPTKTSDLENDSGFITNTVNDLTNYYLKSETYTQFEVNNLIGQIKTISIEVVNTLPTTGEDNKIYLVPKEGSTGDVYNEYIWVNNTWELIGSTQIDLTGYATQDWVNNQIQNFLTESQVTEIVNNSLTNYYTQTQIDNLLKDKANTSDIPTKVSELENDKGYLTETPIASTTVLGGIKVGENLSVTTDGVLNAEAGGVSSYNDLTDKPTLNTANTNSLATNSNETINGTIDLHKVAKTGDYNDLNNKLNIVNGSAEGSLRTVGSAEERDNYILGIYAFAEGKDTEASNYASHAEGHNTTASGYGSHAEGNNTNADGDNSHAEGLRSRASGYGSHAEGYDTRAKGRYSHTEGNLTTAFAINSHAEGLATKANGDNQHVQGKYNISDTTSLDIIGNGADDDNRSNAYTLDASGNAWYSGDVYVGSTSGTNKDSGSVKLAKTTDIPTKTSDLTNNGDGTTGSKYITNADLNTELENKQDKITGGATTIVTDDLTVNRALVSNANGKVVVSNTTSTELGYLSGARSNLQSQIDTITTEGGQPNVIEVVQENGVPLEITNKTVNVIAPTNLVNGIAVGSLRTVGSTKETNTYKLGQYAFAEGRHTMASGLNSHAEGENTVASNYNSHAEGRNTRAQGWSSHAEGRGTIANQESQHVQGNYNISDVTSLDIVGNGTSDEDRSNAYTLDANGNAWYSGDVYVGSTSGTNKDSGSKKLITLDKIPTASSETLGLIKVGENLSITEDGTLSAQAGTTIKNLVDGSGEGALRQINATEASGKNSFAEGHRTTASGDYSHAEGQYSSATNTYSHAEGNNSQATGVGSHAEGSITMATGMYSHTEGNNTKATGDDSHAEGHNTTVGRKCFIIVSGDSEAKTYTFYNVRGLVIGMRYSIHRGTSVAFDAGVITAIDTSTNTITVNNYEDLSENNNYFYIYDRPDVGFTFLPYDGTSHSHAEGQDTVATHSQSHAEGLGTIANGNNQHVQGKYNIADDTSLDIIGNGTGANARSNAYTLDRNGNAWYSGNVYVGSTSGTNKDSGSIRLAKISELDTKVNKTTTIAGINLQNNITVSELVNALKVEMLKIENPVGHIRMETTNTNPATYLGFGTWVLWGSGRVPVGIDTTQTEFNTVEKTGGEKTHTLTLAQIPSHTHTFVGTKHTHSIPAHSHGLNSHTHTVKAHSHTFSGTTSGTGVSVQGILTYPNTLTSNVSNEGKVLGGAVGNAWATNATFRLGSDKNHTHTYSGTTSTVAQFNTGAASGNTANSSVLTSGEATQGGTNSNSGGGEAHNNLQPYITCYMWKRTV